MSSNTDRIFQGKIKRTVMESDKSLAKRALEYLINYGVTDKHDMYIVIMKAFSIKRQTIYNARKEMLEDLESKLKVLS